jgi:hypothetical protein
MRMAGALLVVSIALALGACKPTSVAEAEKKADAKWLEDNGSPEAVSALGRLADKDPKAADWLQAHASDDSSVYIAAWEATERGAAWGPATLRSALLDPVRAETAASAMKRKSPALATFTSDLESAVGRIEGTRASTVASLLASMTGPTSDAAIERRLGDAKTRGAMCRGVGSADSSEGARAVLMKAPPEHRDDVGCSEAITQLAATDAKVFDWLATESEVGLLRVVGKSSGMPCAKLSDLWKEALEKRPAKDAPALGIPLGAGIERCAQALDAMLAEKLDQGGATTIVIDGVDPYKASTHDLKATCVALGRAANDRNVPRRSQERAQDAIAHGCPR